MYKPENMAKVTLEEKIEWVQNVGRNTYIAKYCQTMGKEFLETSCLVTAAALRHRINGMVEWEPAVKNDEEFTRLSKTFVRLNPTFQIAFGEDDDYDVHVLTIHHGYVYQSFFKQFSWDARPFPFQLLEFEEGEIKMTKEFIDLLVGPGLLGECYWDYYLMVPSNVK